MFREEKRQFIHMSLLALAFFLKYLNRWYAILVFLTLFLVVLVVVPQLKAKSHVYRMSEDKYSQGALLYFLVLLILVLIFPLYIVAVSWAILALGDGMATLIGKSFKSYPLPWNKKKTYAGTLAFVIFGAFGAFVLLKWMLPELSVNQAFFLGLKTVTVAAIIESLNLDIDDNLTVALSSAVVLYLLV